MMEQYAVGVGGTIIVLCLRMYRDDSRRIAPPHPVFIICFSLLWPLGWSLASGYFAFRISARLIGYLADRTFETRPPAAPPECPRCSTPVPKHANFCGGCGAVKVVKPPYRRSVAQP